MEENLKDFTINWFVTGFLLTSLLAFAIVFMASNNTIGFGDDAESVFGSTYDEISGNLLEIDQDADSVLNVTSNTNPEVGDLGSRDSVSTGYSAVGSARQFFDGAKNILGWVFSGDSGSMLLAVFAGIIGFLAFYFIVKFIRIGA